MNGRDISKMIEEQSRSRRDGYQLTLGELICKVSEALPDLDDTTGVRYDFGYFFPTTIDSWRGAYGELALNYEEAKSASQLGCKDFLQMLQGALTETFQGYKGGEFKMNKNTPLWVANYGNSGHTAVIGVKRSNSRLFILTGYCEY